VFVALAGVGCAHKAAVVTPTTLPVTPEHVTLAVLPAESHDFPPVADALNMYLTAVHPDGVDVKLSKVSLEVVQLTVECVDLDASCYAKAGSSLGASRMLFAQVSAHKGAGVHVAVTLFDVASQSALGVAEQQFVSADDAKSGVSALVEKMAADAGRY
jgi:hypothetical protein